MSSGCFFFKQKTAYEMRISDWSSDVCSSDLMALQATAVIGRVLGLGAEFLLVDAPRRVEIEDQQVGRRAGRQPAGFLFQQPGRIAGQAGQQLEQRHRAVVIQLDRKSTRLNSSH